MCLKSSPLVNILTPPYQRSRHSVQGHRHRGGHQKCVDQEHPKETYPPTRQGQS